MINHYDRQCCVGMIYRKTKWIINIHTHSKTASIFILFILCAYGFLANSSTFANDLIAMGCPELRHGYGPYDYRTATKEQKQLVEGAHFFPNVENLVSGTKHPAHGYIVIPGGEIDYTLRAFPNHPRALLALSRLSIRDSTDKPEGIKAPVDCYFQSAIKYRPTDSMVRVIYGVHLAKLGQTDKSLEHLQKAEELSGGGANLYYNLGLAYFQGKRYPEALEAAHKAYALGFPLPGLRDMLKRVGQWSEPVVVPVAALPTSQPPAEVEAAPVIEKEPINDPALRNAAETARKPAVAPTN